MSDLQICAWVLVVIAQSHRAWEQSYAGQVSEWAGKISWYYVEESYRRELDLWAEKGLTAAEQEAQC